MRKTTRKKIAPVIITVAVVLYMIPLVLMVLSVLGEANAAALPIMLLYAVLGGAVIIGVIRALLQRLDEIDGVC